MGRYNSHFRGFQKNEAVYSRQHLGQISSVWFCSSCAPPSMLCFCHPLCSLISHLIVFFLSCLSAALYLWSLIPAVHSLMKNTTQTSKSTATQGRELRKNLLNSWQSNLSEVINLENVPKRGTESIIILRYN